MFVASFMKRGAILTSLILINCMVAEEGRGKSIRKTAAWREKVKLLPKSYNTVAEHPTVNLGSMFMPKHKIAKLSFNLGPTGIRASMDREKRHYEVTKVFSNSPASGKVEVGDLIVGANKVIFAKTHNSGFHDDFSINPLMGLEIERSEGPLKGLLTLYVKRKGSLKKVKLKLKPFGSFSKGYPANDLKSELLAKMYCDLIASRQSEDGCWVHANKTLHTTAYCGLALLASGDPAYNHKIKKAVEWMKEADPGFSTFAQAHKALLLGEYYLRFKDKSVLPEIQHCYNMLVDGQFPYNGSGHASMGGNYRGSGFTIASSHALMAYGIANLCRLKVSKRQLQDALDHIEMVAPGGQVPYARYGRAYEPDYKVIKNESAARTGCCAIGFKMLAGKRSFMAKMQEFMSQNSDYMDNGHSTGNTQSWLFGSLGLAMLDRKAFYEHMWKRRWFVALVRRWDAGVVPQPSEMLNFRGGDNALGQLSVIAAHAIVLSAHKKNMAITGSSAILPQKMDLSPALRYSTADLVAYDFRLSMLMEARLLLGKFVPKELNLLINEVKAISLNQENWKQQRAKICSKYLRTIIVQVKRNKRLSSSKKAEVYDTLSGARYSLAIEKQHYGNVIRLYVNKPSIGRYSMTITPMNMKNGPLNEPLRFSITPEYSANKGKFGVLKRGINLDGVSESNRTLPLIIEVEWEGVKVKFKRNLMLPVKNELSEGEKAKAEKYSGPEKTLGYARKENQRSFTFVGKIKRFGGTTVDLYRSGGGSFYASCMPHVTVKRGDKATLMADVKNRQSLLKPGDLVRYTYFYQKDYMHVPMFESFEVLKRTKKKGKNEKN